MTPEQMAALTPAEMESTCMCGHSKADHDGIAFKDEAEMRRHFIDGDTTAGTPTDDCGHAYDSEDPCECDRYRSVWNAGEAQYEQRYSRP